MFDRMNCTYIEDLYAHIDELVAQVLAGMGGGLGLRCAEGGAR